MTRPFLILLAMTVSLVACSTPTNGEKSAAQPSGGVASLDEHFDYSELVIENSGGDRHVFTVYVASNFEQQRRGLMFVRNMPDDVGMLFIYDDDRKHSMWMKNTYIPLDMIFARRDGSVSSIIHDTQPLSLESQGSTEPVAFVLELNAGTSRRLGIDNGSRLIWSRDDQP